jgi:hypothetical protein
MPYVTEDNLTDVPGPLHDEGDRFNDGIHSRITRYGSPHNAAIPAVDARRQVLAHLAGRRIVEMVRDDSTRYR